MHHNHSASYENCGPLLADQLILWPELKVATALDSLSPIINTRVKKVALRTHSTGNIGLETNLQIAILLNIILYWLNLSDDEF